MINQVYFLLDKCTSIKKEIRNPKISKMFIEMMF